MTTNNNRKAVTINAFALRTVMSESGLIARRKGKLNRLIAKLKTNLETQHNDDPGYEEYLESLKSFDNLTENKLLKKFERQLDRFPAYAANKKSYDNFVAQIRLEDSFAQAAKMRDLYRSWLFARFDEIIKAREEIMEWAKTEIPTGGSVPMEDYIEKFDSENDTSFLEAELERTQHSDDTGISPWLNRQKLGNLEHGIIIDLPRNPVGWTVPEEINGYPNPHRSEDATSEFNGCTPFDNDEVEYSLCKLVEHTFAERETAKQFTDRVRKTFKTKGDHSQEIVKTRVDRNQPEPFIATVLESDLNWDHMKKISAERDAHLSRCLNKISTAGNLKELKSIQRRINRYSRDMQRLNESFTWDNTYNGQRKVGIGWDYKRFATATNALADRADELGFSGFRRLKINEFESSRKPTDGDMMDVGCSQGSFLIDGPNDYEASAIDAARAAGDYIGRGAEMLSNDFEAALNAYLDWNKTQDKNTSTEPYYNPGYVFGPAVYRTNKYLRAA